MGGFEEYGATIQGLLMLAFLGVSENSRDIVWAFWFYGKWDVETQVYLSTTHEKGVLEIWDISQYVKEGMTVIILKGALTLSVIIVDIS